MKSKFPLNNYAKSIQKKGHTHVLFHRKKFTPDEMLEKSRSFYKLMDTRRSIREFSTEAVPREVIENIIKTASTAPSGAHRQPWVFCAVSNPEIKLKIKEAAELEEKESYERRMSERWKKDLEALGTDMYKPFLVEAPWLIVVFKKPYDLDENGQKRQNYYVSESVGIACGMLISAIHQAGLVTLTHTPSPMNFLAEVLDRPKNEKAFLVLPVGYPKEPVYVPQLKRKELEEMAVFYE